MSESEDIWTGIEPGDVGFDQGGGTVGFLIRHFSHSPYAHCWVYHKWCDKNEWTTAEAYPGGLKFRTRDNVQTHRVVRAWRNEEEREALLNASMDLVGSTYNYRELFRIIHYRIRANFVAFAVLALGSVTLSAMIDSVMVTVLASVLALCTLYAAIPLKTKLNPRAVICSNHVAQSVLAARPDVTLTYQPQAIWPGRLERDLNVMTWNDYTRKDTE